jgi:two-component system response regulator PilR (NtrC family)
MNEPWVLVVDDEQDIRALVEITLARMNLRTASAATLAQAHERLKEREYRLCITDMRLPDGCGIELVAHLQRHHPQTPVAVITAYGNAQAAVDSLKAGAFDFVSKPVNLDVLRKLVDSALKLSAQSDSPSASETLLGNADSMRALRSMIAKLARSQAPLHITGESGTGKELVARLVHQSGARAGGPFVPVNCGAIPTELMESEFFGHIKGSFTGAGRDKTGLFQAAEGGTLFLDEVADLPLHMQVKLLRALQERSVRPVGAETEVPVNVRVISATHEDLGELVSEGAFRQDLYYRLNVIEVRTPALREHAEDIPLLAHHVLERVSARNGLQTPPTLDPAALQLLCNHAFPGNVRELENVLERALTLCDGSRITAGDLKLRIGDGEARLESDAGASLPEQMEAVERSAIEAALERTRWNKTRAAEQLGMSFRQLRYKIKKLGIE